MLKIQVIAIGKVKEDWMRQGIAEYQKRLGAYCQFEIIELEEYRLPDNPSEAEIARGLEEEGNRILKKAAGLIFPLCIEGEMLSSPQLAQLISSSTQKSGCLSFIIGGCPEDQLFSAYLSASAGPGAPLRAALPCLLHQCRCQVPQITTSSPELLQASGFFYFMPGKMFHVKHLFANKAGFGAPRPRRRRGAGGAVKPPLRPGGFAAARGALARHLHKIKPPHP